MRRIMLVSVLVMGCGEVTADSDASASIDAALNDGGSADAAADAMVVVSAACEQTPSCGEARTLGSADDLFAVTDLCATWGGSEIDSSRNRTATFRVTAGFSVCPEDFTLPLDCSSGTPLCNAGVWIEVDPELQGVDATAACSGAQFAAGARFRIRYDVLGPTQGNQFRTARVRFERACDAACATGEHRCDANQACYRDDEVCFACGLGTREECACRTPDNGVLANCSDCQVRYDDFIIIGQCVSGVCEQDPCATCPCI